MSKQSLLSAPSLTKSEHNHAVHITIFVNAYKKLRMGGQTECLQRSQK